jgi:polyphosphate kinase
VEICFPVEVAELRARIDQSLDIYWKDNVKAREQRTEQTYIRRALEGERVDAQASFLEQASKRKKPDVNVRSLVVKTKTNSGKAKQHEPKVGQPA